MTYDELIKLVNAGFSKEDIQKLTAETKVSKNDEPVVQDPEKSAVESETKVSEEKEEMNDYFSKLNTAMNDFIERLQKMNVTRQSYHS